jgi:uncharacterized protein (TIGR02448 family)
MKKHLLSLLLLSVVSQPTWASPRSLAEATQAVARIYHSSPEAAQVFLEAHDDASAFSFSDGVLRGRAFGDALNLIRSQQPALQASDMELAIAVLQVN